MTEIKERSCFIHVDVPGHADNAAPLAEKWVEFRSKSSSTATVSPPEIQLFRPLTGRESGKKAKTTRKFNLLNGPWNISRLNSSSYPSPFQLRISIVADIRRGSCDCIRLFARKIRNWIGRRRRVIIRRERNVPEFWFNYSRINLDFRFLLAPLIMIAQRQRFGPLWIEASLEMPRLGAHQLHRLGRYCLGDLQDQVYHLEERRGRSGRWGFLALPQIWSRKFCVPYALFPRYWSMSAFAINEKFCPPRRHRSSLELIPLSPPR